MKQTRPMKQLEWLFAARPHDTVNELDRRRFDTSSNPLFSERWLEPQNFVNRAGSHRLAISSPDPEGELSLTEASFGFRRLSDARRFAQRLAAWMEYNELVDPTLLEGSPIATCYKEVGTLAAWWKWAASDVQVLQLAVRRMDSTGFGLVSASMHYRTSGNSLCFWDQPNDDDPNWAGWERCRQQRPRVAEQTQEPTMDEILASIRRIISEGEPAPTA